METKKTELYKNPILHTSQFPMCGNAFRMDTYMGCSFGCKYCFANARHNGILFNNKVCDIKLVEKWFNDAINLKKTSNVKLEMLNRRVPLHLGGMADPFQKREFEHEKTYEFLKISKRYNYPVSISTKAASLPDKYWDVLDPKIHTFQISLIGITDEYIKRFETNTPTPIERIDFIKELHRRGFWVSIRIQPLIEINEALQLIKATEAYVNYYTVEHLKIAIDNKHIAEMMFNQLNKMNIPLICKGREWEFSGEVKRRNIQLIKDSTKVKIGCGDNDFHVLSDSLNCCGIDTMPEAFNNWMKYNSMYIKMTGDRSQWYPKNNCNGCFNSTCIIKGYSNMKQYTDKYYNELYGHDDQLLMF